MHYHHHRDHVSFVFYTFTADEVTHQKELENFFFFWGGGLTELNLALTVRIFGLYFFFVATMLSGNESCTVKQM